MRHILMLAASLAMLSGVATTASAQKLDANGRCHAANGQFAKAEVCKSSGGGAMMSKPSAYKLDAKGNCHDAKGKMAKKDMCKA